MQEYRYIHFLVEDQSGSVLIKKIMEKYQEEKQISIEYKITSFKGIGAGLRKGMRNVNKLKTNQLFNDLPNLLKGLNGAFKNMQGKRAIFVVFDLDRENCVQLKKELLNQYKSLGLSERVCYCIAIEEMEAWLLGDRRALEIAYPRAKLSVLKTYVQDSIVGTWEKLADTVYKGGARALVKKPFYEIGKLKSEWAGKIGEHLDIRKNNSPSFCYFIKKLDEFSQ